jgi:hypothetical protein
VVLAGKSESEDTNQICCLEAHIEIPEYCGNAFEYAVDRLVCFSETSGIATNEGVDQSSETISWNSRDGRAIAIYIKTMRLGLENAEVIMEKCNEPSSVFPISLFCIHPLKREAKAELIASPIPREKHLRFSDIKIHQGELFQVTNPTKESFSGFKNVLWFIDNESKLPSDCVIKVSCATVHNIFVSHSECKEALKVLYDACAKDDRLREEISKVLLGFCHLKSSLSLVTIMKDLQTGQEKFQVLEHRAFKDGKLLLLWVAFCDLVKSLLLPMADLNVVHLDIRSNSDFTHNILVSEMTQGDNYSIELRLIDFDSVVFDGFPASVHSDAVFWNDLIVTVINGVDWKSAHRYLFWQILWIGYTWHLSSSPLKPDVRPTKKNSTNFLTFLFVDDYFKNFKSWLGTEGVEALQNASKAETMTAATIDNALNVLGNAFC